MIHIQHALFPSILHFTSPSLAFYCFSYKPPSLSLFAFCCPFSGPRHHCALFFSLVLYWIWDTSVRSHSWESFLHIRIWRSKWRDCMKSLINCRLCRSRSEAHRSPPYPLFRSWYPCSRICCDRRLQMAQPRSLGNRSWIRRMVCT